ncbi:ribokinase [Zhihengliuella flava]|uniref:Ribokinase n=1 Tax=Zhihengliuella flava TaxID=1285193 RepID=A0A931GF96_9MICC|nr:ribokinase [Zhihengliuella flava]MBG6084422.1 ribokinase [Zhihengliuella flava]
MPAPPVPRVTVIGSLNVDLAVTMQRLPAPGQTVLANTLAVSPGGKGANQALAAALSGAETALIGAVGRDQHASVALELLRGAGVDLTGVATVDGPTGTALIQIDADGENSIAVVPGANALVGVERVRGLGRLGGVVVLQGEIPPEALDTAAAAVRATEHDGGAPARLVLNLAPVVRVAESTLLTADPLVVNEQEARALVGRGGERASTPEGAARALVGLGVRSAVITLGAAGCLVAEPGSPGSSDEPAELAVRCERIDAVPATPVDSTGAGDAFVGALAARLAAGDSLRHAAAAGNEFAARSVTRAGAQASYQPERRAR